MIMDDFMKLALISTVTLASTTAQIAVHFKSKTLSELLTARV